MGYAEDEVLEAIESSPIGGGTDYSETDGKLHPSDADVEISTVGGLVDALDSSSEIIAIANGAELDLSGEEMLDLGSKTLVSYRGWDDQNGGLLYTDSRGYYGSRPYTLFYSYDSPRVTGLRIRGARYAEDFTRWDYDDNLARGIMFRGSSGEVDNCEMWGWPWTAIHLKGNGEDIITEGDIHHNYIHKSYQIGYGYAVSIWRGFGNIHHNYIDETRHAINGYGWWNSGYTVENNVFGPNHYSHILDMHCLEENNASARVGDDPDHPDYDLRAGGEMQVYNNTFCTDKGPDDRDISAITIRGVPWDGIWIENNRFVHAERPPYNSGNNQEGFAWRQVNLELSGWSSIPQDEEGYTSNWNDDNNQFDAPNTSRESDLGAPINITGSEENSSVLTITGQESTAHYTFTVDGNIEKSNEYNGTINSYDEIRSYDDLDSVVTGRTTNEPDSFHLDGNITSLSASSSIELLINGEDTDESQFEETTITIDGRGSTTQYAFEVIGNVEKSTAYNGTINSYDEIENSEVTGRTTNERDSYTFSGEVVNYTGDSPANVLLNGQPTGIWM